MEVDVVVDVDMDLPTYLGRYYVGHTIFLYRARSIGAITLPLLFADASSFIKTLISTYLRLGTVK